MIITIILDNPFGTLLSNKSGHKTYSPEMMLNYYLFIGPPLTLY